MKRVSIEESYLWTQRFVQHEWRLLLPVALAFNAVPALALEALFPPELRAQLSGGGNPAAIAGMGWLMLATLPAMLLNLAGSLVLTALALRPGISVREAIAHGFARLPAMIGVALIGLVLMVLASIVLGILLIALPVPTRMPLLVTLLFFAMLSLCVRLLPVVPVLVERRVGPVAAIRLSWEATQGAFWRLLAAIGLYMIVGAVILMALSSAIGVTMILVGRLVGAPEAGRTLAAVVSAILGSLYYAGLPLLAAPLYAQLAANRSA